MSRSAGNGNYTLSVWTNFSIPAPNLVVDSLTLPQNVNPGDTVAIDISVTNDGTEDLNSSYLVDVYLQLISVMTGMTITLVMPVLLTFS